MRNIILSLLVCAISLGLPSADARSQELSEENLAILFKGAKQKTDVAWRTVAIEQLGQLGPKAAPALPDLLDALQTKNEGLRLAAAMTLAKIGKPAIEPVVKLLQSPDPGTRFYAVWTLGFMGPHAKGTMPAVMDTLGDKNADVRRKAVFTLGRLQADPDKTIAALGRAFLDSDPLVQREASEALAKFGSRAVPTLIGLLKSDAFLVRQEAIACLGTIGSEAKDSVPALQELMLAKDGEHIEKSARALGLIGPAALPALKAGFKDGRSEVRAVAAVALETLRADAVPFFLECMNEKRVELRRLAAKALASMNFDDRQVALAIAAGLADEDDAVRIHCTLNLHTAGRHADVAAPKVRDALTDMNPTMRSWAYGWLHRRGEEPQEKLQKLLNSKNERQRINAACLLMGIDPQDTDASSIVSEGFKSKDVALQVQSAYANAVSGRGRGIAQRLIPIFVAGLKHKSAGVRMQSAQGISFVGEGLGGASEPLAEALGDSDPEVREAAVTALRLIAREDTEVHAIMSKHMKNGDADVRIAVLKCIALCGGGHPIRAAGLKDRNERVREQALESIKLEAIDFLDELDALRKDKSPEIRMRLIPLFQSAGEKGVPHLVEMLKDVDVDVRQSACMTLGLMAEAAKKALPALHAMQKDPIPRVRLSALDALGKIGGWPAAIPVLKAAVKDEDGLIRVSALSTLVTIGGEQPAKLVPPLIECLRDPDDQVRLRAIYSLHPLGAHSAAALPLLRELAKNDSDPTVRRFADVATNYIESMMKKQ